MKYMVEKFKKILIPIAIIIAGIFIAGAMIYVNQRKENTLSPQAAAQKAIDFINKNLLQQGTTASLVNVTEENGLYKLSLKIGDKEYTSYVSKDGKLLFPNEGINLEEKPAEKPTEKQEQKKLTCEDIKKSENPQLEAFVVSKCPFGLQMQRILNEIVKNIPSLAGNIRVEYIGAIENGKITSMHGDEEAQENLRQICLREEQQDKYWKYIDCHIKKGDIESCLTGAGVDKSKLDGCMNDNSRGIKYAKADFDLGGKYQVSGSPTLILEGEKVSEFDFGGRTAQAVKTLLCCGFQNLPDICSQKLTEEQAATGFSETYSQSSGSSGGSCK
ncbi:MAG: hypothetical protein CO077_02675 [Candidatus Nealsonbacteria bacterium CG_4_9_14_0_8_um_filter_35_12]|uniref:Thioredoxin-like fold domain-containing protein n=1 Tax=Candidatus Nealsonbacteria bacterium CG_4_9_14_0_8_um_filter_35_12 TaxID=1974692 RepID=A0A2M8DMF4_9BACT|nr:MAG: hypothetical protein CO077_02675 [Candidatus Nealsonbacteria bacterium CG_4_9_14_0_8_um_filter_35_12]